MGVVIAGVDAPLVAGMGVRRSLHSVGYQVPHHSYIVLVVPFHPTHHRIFAQAKPECEHMHVHFCTILREMRSAQTAEVGAVCSAEPLR